jgi:hypothetical protein
MSGKMMAVGEVIYKASNNFQRERVSQEDDIMRQPEEKKNKLRNRSILEQGSTRI